MFHGCGHSYHRTCIITSINECPRCEKNLVEVVKTLAKAAKESIVNPKLDEIAQDDDDDDGDDREYQDDNINMDPIH